MKDTTYFFLHIPKSAGSTLKYSLNYIYKKSEIFHVNNRIPKVSIKDGLNKLSLKKQSKLKMVAGHGYYGMHSGLASNKNFKYFTFLRNPKSRIISLYNQVLNSKVNENEIAKYIDENDASLDDLINCNLFQGFHNDQCRLIAGLPFDKNITEEELFEKAKMTIENDFEFIGIQEHFLLSLLMLKENLNWKKQPHFLSINKSKSKSIVKKSFSSQTLQLIDSNNQADQKLYDLYLKKFLESYHENKNDWDSKLNQFEKKNEIYSQRNHLLFHFKKESLHRLSKIKRQIL